MFWEGSIHTFVCAIYTPSLLQSENVNIAKYNIKEIRITKSTVYPLQKQQYSYMKGPATKPTTNTPKRKLPELSTSASPTVRKNPFLDLPSPYSARPCTPCGPPLSVFSIGQGLAIKCFSQCYTGICAHRC